MHKKTVMWNSNLCNIQSCCRLCLTADLVTLKSIFDESVEKALPQKILQYVGIEIKKADKISTAVCSQCISKVIGFHTFKEQCTQNQMELEEWPMNQTVDMNGTDETSFHIKDEPMGESDDESYISEASENRIEMFQAKNEPIDQIEEEFNELPPVLSPQPHDSESMLNGSFGPALQENTTFQDAYETALSKVELSYIEKCKAMINMHQTLICACHNEAHHSLQYLRSHLRALKTWFPVFTCYNCMITFTNHSTFGSHRVRCSSQSLNALTKLSNLSKRSFLKTRVYQNFKCTVCKFIFTFHEDFCEHLEKKHPPPTFPFRCQCSRIFNTIDDYKDHVHLSCLVNFCCDLCFITTKTLDDFQKHARDVHDNSEGFTLRQDDNYRTKPPMKDVVAEDVVENGVTLTEIRKSRAAVRTCRTKKHASNICGGCGKSFQVPTELEQHKCEHFNNKVNRNSPQKTQPHERTAISLRSKEEKGKDANERLMATLSEAAVELSTSIDRKMQKCDISVKEPAGSRDHKKIHLKRKTVLSKISLKCGNWDELRSQKLIHKKSSKSNKIVKNRDSSTAKCSECSKIFSFKHNMLRHMKCHEVNTSPAVKDVQKPNCNNGQRVCHTTKEAAKNKETYFEETKPAQIFCKSCKISFYSEDSLKKHIIEEHDEGTIPKTGTTIAKPEKKDACNICAKNFTTTAGLASHIGWHKRTQSETNTKLMKQDKPLTKLVHSANIKQKPIYEPKFQCVTCLAELPNDIALQVHTLEMHRKISAIMLIPRCDTCNKDFITQDDYETHKRFHEFLERTKRHEQIGQQLEESQVIPLKMTERNKVAAQPKPAKNSPKPAKHFPCKYCSIEFSRSDLLEKHVRQDHNKFVETFKCTQCNRIFEKQSSLSNHLRVHEKNRVESRSASKSMIRCSV